MTLHGERGHGEYRLAGDGLRALHLIDDSQGGVSEDVPQGIHREHIGRLERTLEGSWRLDFDLAGAVDHVPQLRRAHAAAASPWSMSLASIPRGSSTRRIRRPLAA